MWCVTEKRMGIGNLAIPIPEWGVIIPVSWVMDTKESIQVCNVFFKR